MQEKNFCRYLPRVTLLQGHKRLQALLLTVYHQIRRSVEDYADSVMFRHRTSRKCMATNKWIRH